MGQAGLADCRNHLRAAWWRDLIREAFMQQMTVNNGAISLNVMVDGPAGSADLPILCVHGWPELAYSWRHQVAHFAKAGRRIAAMDVRGYGSSSKPDPVSAYTMVELTGDVAAVIDALGGKAILFGHDWGAPIVWNTALRHGDKVAAVAGLSVPYSPMGDSNFLDLARQIYAGKFFYQLYFQTEGVAEAEFEADPDALAKIYFGLSGDAPATTLTGARPADSQMLTNLPMPKPLPAWMNADDLAVYQAAFKAGGWRGPFNRYRAQDQDFAEREPVKGRHITQPAAFIAGSRDPVRRFIPGVDMYERAGAFCDNFRGATIIEGIGHWVQQEAPEATNAALDVFVNGL
jgi:pimeloyl-ACP methyl ester carboxylesterase